MKAMILAAGLGTRLRPWTLSHPKALVPVDGVPMLERVIMRLKDGGVTDIVVNVHHFADQIKEFLAVRDYGVNIFVSDESGRLLDTGGGIALGYERLRSIEGDNTLIYNVDILSNVNISHLFCQSESANSDIMLVTSDRDSSRKLIFDNDDYLRGWHNIISGEFRPSEIEEEFRLHFSGELYEAAFSGIYGTNDRAMQRLYSRWKEGEESPFPIMDFFLDFKNGLKIKGYSPEHLELLDIGKPAALERASEFIVNNL